MIKDNKMQGEALWVKDGQKDYIMSFRGDEVVE